MKLDRNGNPDVSRSEPWPALPDDLSDRCQAIKLAGNQLLADIQAAVDDDSDRRHIALAATHIETGLMFAIKGLTAGGE